MAIIDLHGWSKDKRWVERKKEWRRKKIIVAVAFVSDCDYDKLSERSWYKNSSGYAQSDYPTRVLMHTLIAGHKMTDHKDRDKLNNQRENLRPCTAKQNIANSGPKGKIKYKGVSFCKQTGKYRVHFRGHIGRYNTEVEAAHMYNLAVLAAADNEFEYLNEVPV